jgi:hypothetical protein
VQITHSTECSSTTLHNEWLSYNVHIATLRLWSCGFTII